MNGKSKCIKWLLMFAMLPAMSVGTVFAQQVDSSECIDIISGDAKNQLVCDRDLLKMSRDTATWKDHDGVPHLYTGVPLKTLLQMAHAPMGGLRGKALNQYALIRCADGYSVLFSLAELDTEFTNLRVILADRMDGKALPADKGPFRLIVPDDSRAARSAFRVREILIGSPTGR